MGKRVLLPLLQQIKLPRTAITVSKILKSQKSELGGNYNGNGNHAGYVGAK